MASAIELHAGHATSEHSPNRSNLIRHRHMNMLHDLDRNISISMLCIRNLKLNDRLRWETYKRNNKFGLYVCSNLRAGHVPSESWPRTKTVNKKEEEKINSMYGSVLHLYIVGRISRSILHHWVGYYPVVKIEIESWTGGSDSKYLTKWGSLQSNRTIWGSHDLFNDCFVRAAFG